MDATLIYPHQLFREHPGIKPGRSIFLAEDPLFFRQYQFHRQKLMLHRASMKNYEAELRKKHDVHYIEANELTASSEIGPILKRKGVDKILCVEPSDDYLKRGIAKACQDNRLGLTWLEDPAFLTSTDTIHIELGSKKKLFFTSFYIEQRKRLGCLLDDDGSPVGGKWSFDTENRKRVPKDLKLPSAPSIKQDRFSEEARTYVSDRFPNAIGPDVSLLYPHSRRSALKWLEQFVSERLALFGDYEDAILVDQSVLFHSCLTPMLNIGLISPNDIIQAALKQPDVPINSLEGFIRQVIGWREFIRGIYLTKGQQQRTTNFWNHHRSIPHSFYDGTTGIEPIDTVIRRLLKTGYCHHIERLMILGNFMLLCEFHPNEVYRWFMELFIDSYDWVMVPNVYGMSQHADGGLMTTKPYISGSSYVLKMSDFKKGDWCPIWDSLYWNFIAKQRTFFEKNPRMKVMTSQLDKMGAKLQEHQTRANKFLDAIS
ncbi:MAG: cryptochrome/photolyase family protein [Pirellula sp.]|nr:cryptochrome/photolyase family protein [Pirellula sp.]